MDWKQILKAGQLAAAIENSLIRASAYEIVRQDGMVRGCINSATLDLAKLADAMGFDLVKRKAPEQPKDYDTFGNLPVYADAGPDDGLFLDASRSVVGR
jgi:hypothetical protein